MRRRHRANDRRALARCDQRRRDNGAGTRRAMFRYRASPSADRSPLRIGLAAGRLHHLADEPADQLRLGLRLRDLVGIGGDDLVDRLLDRAECR